MKQSNDEISAAREEKKELLKVESEHEDLPDLITQIPIRPKKSKTKKTGTVKKEEIKTQEP